MRVLCVAGGLKLRRGSLPSGDQWLIMWGDTSGDEDSSSDDDDEYMSDAPEFDASSTAAGGRSTGGAGVCAEGEAVGLADVVYGWLQAEQCANSTGSAIAVSEHRTFCDC